MNRNVVIDLAWGVGILLLALASTFARSQGWIDGDTVTRIVLGAIGLMVAWFGNRMPKRFVPSERARRASRFGGWSMALTGLVYAGAFAFAPLSLALVVGPGAVLVGLIATVAYCLWLRGQRPANT